MKERPTKCIQLLQEDITHSILVELHDGETMRGARGQEAIPVVRRFNALSSEGISCRGDSGRTLSEEIDIGHIGELQMCQLVIVAVEVHVRLAERTKRRPELRHWKTYMW